MNTRLAPIVLFTYNRPKHTRLVLEALKKNYLASESILIIYQDGIKEESSEHDLMNWRVVNNIIKDISGFKEIIIRSSNKNQGCDPSMINGITEVLNEYGKIIVLEDDLIVSSAFLEFTNYCLENFQNTNVGCINAFNYQVKDLPKYFFIKGANPMGWATWKEKWNLYEHNTEKLIRTLSSRSDRNDFDFGSGLNFLYAHKESKLNGGRDVVWSASLFVNDQLCLWPAHSFVNHIGFDGTGTHSKSNQRNTKMNQAQFQIEELAPTFDSNDIISIEKKVDKRSLRKMRHFYFQLSNKPFTIKEIFMNRYYLFKHFAKTGILKF